MKVWHELTLDFHFLEGCLFWAFRGVCELDKRVCELGGMFF